MDIWTILEYTASVTVIGLLIWLIKLIFHDKLDARWHYFIWLVLLVRIIVPVSARPVPTPFSVFDEIPVGKWIEMGRILADKKGYGELSAKAGRMYLWGAVMLGGFYLAMWAILRIQVAMAPGADALKREQINEIASKYGLKSCRDIRIRRNAAPYVCGLLCPVLVLPEGGLPEESVIVHELLHKRYKDVLVNLGIHAVRVVNWFNPIVWLLTSVVLNDSEALRKGKREALWGIADWHEYRRRRGRKKYCHDRHFQHGRLLSEHEDENPPYPGFHESARKDWPGDSVHYVDAGGSGHRQ